MRVDVLLTPAAVTSHLLTRRAVAVFDLLRATTTITAALAAGVKEIRIFDSIEAALSAAHAHGSDRILCGERNCLPPAGFDLGNSPGGFSSGLHAGRTVFMATTNGTRAIMAVRPAKVIFTAALVNASAVAAHLVSTGLDITLLCAGTDGQSAPEDLLGAGAVLNAIAKKITVFAKNEIAENAFDAFQANRSNMRSAIAKTAGGQNVAAVGLVADIDFAARLDSIPFVGQVNENPLRIVRL